MAKIRCKGLKKEFGTGNNAEIAVNSVNFEIPDGDFVTIVGPSGCGKTTLLRMLAGLETPTSGRIHFDEKDVTELRPQERDISMVFQSIALFPFKSVNENIRYGLKYTDVPKEEVDEKVRTMAEMVGIEDYLANKPGQLSGGQRQRAALARALVRDPAVFLLDEPMSDLDAALKTQLRADIQELHKQLPNTTLYVTHDQEEAMTLSDQIIVMNNGNIEQIAPPDEIFLLPNNVFVARFIGSPTMNVLEGKVEDGRISTELTEFSISDDIYGFLNGDSEVLVGIRPSSLEIIGEKDYKPNYATFSAKLNIFEQLGDETILYMHGNNQTEITAKVHSNLVPEYDQEFNLGFNVEESLYLFDKSDGSLTYPKRKNTQQKLTT